MSSPPKLRPPRIPPQNRGTILILSVLVLTFGIWTMISGRIGRDPAPIVGTPAIVLGAVIAGFAAAMIGIAWSERGRTDP